jgi:hypothetical protein
MVDEPGRVGEVPAGDLADDELTRALRAALDDQLAPHIRRPPPAPVEEQPPAAEDRVDFEPPPPPPPQAPAPAAAPPAPEPPRPREPEPDPDPRVFAELGLDPEVPGPAARLATQLSRLTVAVVATRETLRRVTERLDQGTIQAPISLDDVRDIVDAAVADGFAPLAFQIERLRSQVEALGTATPAPTPPADDGWFDDDDDADD